MKANGHNLWSPYLPKTDESPIQFFERCHKKATRPETTFVPETVYSATFGSCVAGRTSLRPPLEGALRKIDGPKGYVPVSKKEAK